MSDGIFTTSVRAASRGAFAIVAGTFVIAALGGAGATRNVTDMVSAPLAAPASSVAKSADLQSQEMRVAFGTAVQLQQGEHHYN